MGSDFPHFIQLHPSPPPIALDVFFAIVDLPIYVVLTLLELFQTLDDRHGSQCRQTARETCVKRLFFCSASPQRSSFEQAALHLHFGWRWGASLQAMRSTGCSLRLQRRPPALQAAVFVKGCAKIVNRAVVLNGFWCRARSLMLGL